MKKIGFLSFGHWTPEPVSPIDLQSSTLKVDESAEPSHVQQARQIHAHRKAGAAAGHAQPRAFQSAGRSLR